MIDVSEATNKAKTYLTSFFPDAEKVQLEEVELTSINLVFEPQWDKSMLTEEAKLELGLL